MGQGWGRVCPVRGTGRSQSQEAALGLPTCHRPAEQGHLCSLMVLPDGASRWPRVWRAGGAGKDRSAQAHTALATSSR